MIPFGNDTIQARDGEVDPIDCGPGRDVAVVDAIDVMASDCETVERGGAGAVAGGGGAGGHGPGGDQPRPDAAARMRVRAVGRPRSMLVVRLSGMRTGAVVVRARLGRRVVASARATVGRDGTATVRLRLSPAARRPLAARGLLRLRVTAGTLSRALTARR